MRSIEAGIQIDVRNAQSVNADASMQEDPEPDSNDIVCRALLS
jgi:hypothetical protein